MNHNQESPSRQRETKTGRRQITRSLKNYNRNHPYADRTPSYIRTKTPSTIRIVRGFTRGKRPQDTNRERQQASSSAGLANQLSPKLQPPRTPALATDVPQQACMKPMGHKDYLDRDAMIGTSSLDVGVKWGVVPPASAVMLKRSGPQKEKDDGVERVPRSGPLRCDMRGYANKGWRE